MFSLFTAFSSKCVVASCKSYRYVNVGASLLVCVLGLQSQTQSSTGMISGVVVGDDGKFLEAVVTANSTGSPPAGGRAESASDGSFTISGLPAGVYELCAAVLGGGYLDPCAWSEVQQLAQITPGRTLAGRRLVLLKGSVLQVRVNDPANALEVQAGPNGQNSPNTVAPHLILGLFTGRNLFLPMGMAAKDAGGRNYQGTVPLDRDATLHLVGKDLQVTNATGAPIDLNGTSITVPHPSANSPQPPLTFNVSKAP